MFGCHRPKKTVDEPPAPPTYRVHGHSGKPTVVVKAEGEVWIVVPRGQAKDYVWHPVVGDDVKSLADIDGRLKEMCEELYD